MPMSTKSMAGSAIAALPVGSPVGPTPLVCELLQVHTISGGDGVQHRPAGQIEEVARLQPGIGVDLSHEFRSEQRNVERRSSHGHEAIGVDRRAPRRC